MSSITDLVTVVQKLRSEKYKHIPVDLVTQIIAAEVEHADDHAEALRDIGIALEDCLSMEEDK